MSWEDQKENILPIPQGRNIATLMKALSLGPDLKTKRKLLEIKKERFEKELEEHKEDLSKQLDLWYDYIDWIEQNVPEGGKVNGLSNAIEQCIEIYYNRKEFKQDERLFDIFMKFKQFCDEPVEVFGFMYANSIATLLARFYLNWSWQYEIKKNMKRAEDLLKLGVKNLASPREVLGEALTQLKFRLDRMLRNGELNDTQPQVVASNLRQAQSELAAAGIRAALQTLKFKTTKKDGAKVAVNRTGIAVDHANIGGLKGQTTEVNGLRVPKKPSLRPRTATSNAVVRVLSEDGENGELRQQQVGDENNPANLVKKIPTLQRIQLVGRTGAENFPKRIVITDENKPPALLD